ncbi:CDP-alcohol phosphatidyltransferase family protein [Providencia sp. PROV188]|jgi:phosphatidylglycerophosphate synthase|uniref:Phosphatidylglycerophosphate synthase n=1 Tax=Providencia alcalifaciens TaxID=126385 RepID=A0A4V2V3U4_9GAMM|nr:MULTISPECIES: CDP-alcohol phosphatidyltransferase family protein [Providencia]ETS99170.1 CDP-alcohol phosphatidyltransferase [Providencia alcalifaciens PAL-3]EUD01145.1 CDP-alcohol phosphatidyltransferase [Providencia alcalifaciens PAL-1]MBC5790287.1 CDP-alcohol phosphatidyltransferase family protein [Providencia sp. JUb39]MBS0923739.1 CDP-alcohol phosphatidyltransferase family protein [Providencia sp. JGM181]MBS0932434.1 CDP-alcohol phosphatidyltransferase family protein [Providencia sp. J
MTIYDLKPKFQNLLRPIVRQLFEAGITANQVTLAALGLSIIVGALLAIFPSPYLFILLPFVLFIRMALNAIDGMLAREHNQKSHLGAMLNELGDVISDVALYLPFVLIFPHAFWWILLILFLSVLTEFIGVIAQAIGASRRYDGPVGKSDRAFVFGALGLFVCIFPQLMTASWINILFVIFALLLSYTCYNRIRRALTELSAVSENN